MTAGRLGGAGISFFFSSVYPRGSSLERYITAREPKFLDEKTAYTPRYYVFTFFRGQRWMSVGVNSMCVAIFFCSVNAPLIELILYRRLK